MSYYEDDDEVDIRLRRGRASPARFPERHRPTRSIYYQHGSSYLAPEVSGSLYRSRSQGRRASPPPTPVVINNRIYNDFESEEAEDDRYLQLAHPVRSRSRSRSRPSSYASREDYELEKTRKELDAYRLEAQREKEEKRIKKELELQRLRDEKQAEDEKKRIKKEADEAVEKFKLKEAERIAKEKKEKEEREKEYQRRLEEDLRKSGLDERQISVITKTENANDPSRPTYTKMSRKYLSIETLNRYRIDYEFDTDPDYVLIKRWVPEYEQDFLWSHTREIRERRAPALVAIEGKKNHHHETEFEFIRKKKHERKPSPSPLLTFLAGGRR